jgi:hypothetical protein
MTRTLLACFIALLTARPAEANTRFGIGTIVAVDEAGKTFVIRYEFQNLMPDAVWPSQTFAFQERTRHGVRVYFLDGQPSTALEAVKAGRAIAMTENNMICLISSRPGPLLPESIGEPGNALYHLTLNNACPVSWIPSKEGQPLPEKAANSTAELLIDVRDGTIVAASVVLTSLPDAAADLDCQALHWDGTQLTGTVTATLQRPDRDGISCTNGPTLAVSYQITLSSDAAGTISGTFTGTGNTAAVRGALSGRRISRLPLPTTALLWFDLPIPGVRAGYAVVPVMDGTGQAGGYLLFKKGHRIGEITAQSILLDQGRLTGSLTGVLNEENAATPFTVTFSGSLLGGRLAFGSTSTVVAGAEPLRQRFRAGVWAAGTTQIEGATTEQKAQAKQIQAALK